MMMKMMMLTILSALLIHAPPILATRNQQRGGQPVPAHIIQEARALNARYHHLVTQQDLHRRIHRQRQRQRHRNRNLNDNLNDGLDDNEGFSIFNHLFDPVPEADNEQEDPDGDTTANKVTLRQVGLEGSANPLFFCSHCTQQDQHAQEECARCKGFLHAQQDRIAQAVLEKYPDAHVVAKTTKLVNMVFIEMAIAPHDDIAAMDHALSRIPGVLRIMPQEDSTLDDAKAVNYIGGGTPLETKFCGVNGKGVRMAILDSGIDYTHSKLGGAGTKEAYELAYGTSASSPENKQVNPSIFPTDRVIGGRDFLGESFVHTAESIADDATPDDNPIDANRHGTMVADAVLSVAPETQLLACKVCTSDTGTCPGFAVLQALEYALDPNEDDNLDDKVDIINLSLGGSYLSSYYDLRTEALEKVFQLGVLPVVAAGNEGNIPYIGGPGAKTPNAVSVAATNGWGKGKYSYVTAYSSRGPGDQNTLKPDIAAPSGLTLAAFGTGSDFFPKVQGTSFAAPVVAGALSLIRERCPKCSPFALKAILMNNAKRHVQYNTLDVTMSDTSLPDDDAPNSLVGAGEVQVEKALDSDVWAYCVEDVQPSLSFGLINAHQQIKIKKTIKVINLSGNEQTLSIREQFAAKKLESFSESQANPISFEFSPTEQVLAAGCNSEVEFQVTMIVDATKAPKNRMTSGGEASNDPTLNDWNEFGGWVIIKNAKLSKDVSLAYHAVIRQSSDLKIEGTSVIENFQGGPTDVKVGLTNNGAGVAQVDAFELLFTSEDDPEGGYGDEVTPSDFRYIGYRVFKTDPPANNCDYLLEFSFTTWEKQKRLNLEFFQVHLDVNLDNEIDYVLFNSGVFTPFTDTIGCIVRNKKTGEIKCSGLPPDHSTNTANTVLRVCSNDIGFETPPFGQTKLNVYILTATATHLGVTEVTDRASQQFRMIEFPQAWISAPSYDILPGETLDVLQVDGTGGNGRAQQPLGLVLITNSYRAPDSTGAATRESEALVLTNGPLTLPVEITPDELIFPEAKVFDGPECAAWESSGNTCSIERSFDDGSALSGKSNPIEQIFRMQREEESSESFSSKGATEVQADAMGGHSKGALDTVMFQKREGGGSSKCPEIAVPRSAVLRVPGSTPMTPSPTTGTPMTPSPTQSPSSSNQRATTQSPAPTSGAPEPVSTQSPTSPNGPQTAAPSIGSATQGPTIATKSPVAQTSSPSAAPQSAARQTAAPTASSTTQTTASPTVQTTTSPTGTPTNSPTTLTPSRIFSAPKAESTAPVSTNTDVQPTAQTPSALPSATTPTQSPSVARVISVATPAPSAGVDSTGTQKPSAQAATSAPSPQRVVHVETTGTPVRTTAPSSSIAASDNTSSPSNANASQTSVPTPLRGTPRPTGPISSAIVMYGPSQSASASASDTPGLPFFSASAPQHSFVLTVGLGLLTLGAALVL